MIMRLLCSLAVTSMLTGALAEDVVYDPISFPYCGDIDKDLIGGTGSTFPKGYRLLGGIPFYIPPGGQPNWWHSECATGPNPRVLDIWVDRQGVTEVHTLINTCWGVPSETSLVCLEFFGSAGAFYRSALVSNVDVRDFDGNGEAYANTVNGTTTVEVFNNGMNQRIDKQKTLLPEEFRNQALSIIRICDNGALDVQRSFLYGVTVGGQSAAVRHSRQAYGALRRLAPGYPQNRQAGVFDCTGRRISRPAGESSPAAGLMLVRGEMVQPLLRAVSH